MNRVAVVLGALAVAVHVAIPALGIPAPLPVLLAFAAVLGALCWGIAETVARDGAGIEPKTLWRKA